MSIRYLGASSYGLWLAAIAALAWLSWGQAGLAPGLANALATSDGERRSSDAGVYFTTALGLVLPICAVLYVVGEGILNWGGPLFIHLAGPNAPNDPSVQSRWYAFLQVALFLGLLRLPLGLIESAFVGLQRIHVLRLFDILGQCCAIAAAALLLLGKPPAAVYLLSLGFATESGVMAASLFLISKLQPELRPSLSKFNFRKSRSMFSLSAGYLIVQITGYVVASVGILILSAHHGPAAVPAFALTWQLYQMAAGIWTMFITALWGAFAEARARGDWNWIERTQQRLVRFTTGCSVAFGLLLALMGGPALRIWSGGKVHAEPSFFWVMGIYTVLFSWTIVHGEILSALNQVWRQIRAAVANALLVVAFALLLVPPYGTLGLAISLAAACALTTAWAYPAMLARTRKAPVACPA